MKELQELVTFLRLAGRLKKEKRRGWVQKAGVAQPESVADHSWRTALIAMLVGELKGVDACRMVKTALIHDLGECLVGDLTPEDEEEMKKQKAEDDAVRRMFAHLPSTIRPQLHGLWKEFQEGGTPEARLIRELDKVEMVLQAFEYEEEGYEPEKLQEFKRCYAQDGLASELLAVISRLRPG